MSTPAAVLFDCDGVLVDSEPITARLIAQNLTASGFAIGPADIHSLFTGGTMASVREMVVGRGVDLPLDWVAQMNAVVAKVLAETVEPMPEIGTVLDLLDARAIPYGVVSNGPIGKMQATLGRTGLWDRFASRMFSAHVVGLYKPDPALYLHAAREIGVDPARCAVVEDSATGLRAGVAAGMMTYGITTDVSAEQFRALGGIPFSSMSDLPAMLGII